VYGGHFGIGVQSLCEGILEEAQVGPPKDASVVGVELYVDNLLVVRARYGDCSGESDFDGGVNGS
jgi:hypothetical protein